MHVDLDGWSVIGPEVAGRDERKLWVAPRPGATRADHWLWKPRRTTGDGTVPAINDAVEVIASRLADRLRLPAADCRFAIRHGERGLISHNVTPHGHDLHGGDVFLGEVQGYVRRPTRIDAAGRERGRVRQDEGYTLEAVEQVLADVPGPPGWEQHTAYQVFAGYLVLDALIANTDRHPRNWALLERRGDGQRFLAPTFDHGSALGYGMTDEQRARRNVEEFCRRGQANPFTPRGQRLRDLALRAVARAKAEMWVDRLASLTLEDFRATLEAPPENLSVVASTFIEQVLTVNRRRLCHVNGD